MPNRPATAVRLALALCLGFAGAASAADNGFAAFWKTFAAAARADDKTALAGMVVLGPGLDETATTFAQFHAHALGPKARACVARAKPTRAIDGNGKESYGATCGDLIFVFYATPTGWKLTDVGPDD